MKLGTSLRFLYPTGAHTHTLFQQMLAAAAPGSFIERPLGATDTGEQARNVLEVAAAARAAGLDGLLFGDNHAVPAAFANSFAPIPTLARLMAVTGEMALGLVLLAPFYHPIVLAEQIGTLAAFASGPLIVTLANGGRAQAFEAFGLPIASRAARLEELVAIVRALLAGERVSFRGKYFTLENVSISPLPRVPVSIWIAGTVPAAAARAGRIGDGWLSGQNATRAELAQQLGVYREAAERAGRPALPVLRRDIYVGESDAEAEATAGRVLAEGYRGTGTDQLLIGGAESIVAKLREYRELGFGYVMVRHIVGDHDAMLRSFARIGESVMPAIRNL
ncbi:MAG TPA: LLM class flavin-dependent oxidoreductase [Myxococcota bacterium]|nr:LLM class flavin-dependent oxidoreductase [Myxococcota bacterium]